MMGKCFFSGFTLSVLLCTVAITAQAQLGFDLHIDKPEIYENRVLKAEQTPEKKIKFTKRLFQNLTTRYNYFFNANNKLNQVIAQAKAVHKDDYSQMLPFYNYSLDATAANAQLDSVIYKAQTGIVIHDLRNSWIDNLYMLWGASYYFQKQFDSAALMFQFINYAFAPKEKDGYYKYIGSRMDGSNAISIATSEDKSLLSKAFSTTPSRNDAFIWQIRTLIEMGQYTSAGSLIAALKNDPAFPERLKNSLEEVQAYWFYKQELWDSSARHLVHALDVATNSQEKARWEYLAAQLYEQQGNLAMAHELYQKAIAHATDPVMDVYARLNLVRTATGGEENYLDRNLADLLKMARREKFADYRDVIYYMAAQLELGRNDLAEAEKYLLKAAEYNNGNLSGSNAYLQIAHLSFRQKKYLQAAAFYDSVATDALPPTDAHLVNQRKAALAGIVTALKTIHYQDSLQKVAAMPEEERNAFITRTVKKMRKAQGLADENAPLTAGNSSPFGAPAANDLFAQPAKGEWYFYNSNLKTSGAVQFKQTWGNRPNADNWRRFAQVSKQLLTQVPNNTRPESDAQATAFAAEAALPTFEGFARLLPLTPEALQASNNAVNDALFSLGMDYLNRLEDYPSAIDAFERLRSRTATHPKMEALLFNLYFAYNKTGNIEEANTIKAILNKNYPASRWAAIATTGADPGAANEAAAAATKDYEAIYDMFIEGQFARAEAAKKRADSVYKTNYWQPQLLYIEAVYQVKQRNDSAAISTLQTLVAQNPATPLAAKAQNLINILGRRAQIEAELNNWQIKDRPNATVAQNRPAPPPLTQAQTAPEQADTASTAATLQKNTTVQNTGKTPVKTVPSPLMTADSLANKTVAVSKKNTSVYTFEPSLNHYAVIVLNKVDAVFTNEAKNAFNRYNQEKYYSQPLSSQLMDLDTTHKLLLIGGFVNAQMALDYVQQAQQLAPHEIIPWLKPEKYSFTIISPSNLEVLQKLQNLSQYQKFLEDQLRPK